MIADISKNANSSEIKKYVNYCISPKKEQENEPKEERAKRLKLHKELKKSDKLSSERVAAFYSDEMDARPGAVDGFVELIENWTRESKKGRPATAKTPKVLMGSFSWSPKDNITPDRAVELAREYLLEEMGGSYRPGMFVCHVDKEHTHVHFVVAAVGADGLVYDPAGRGETFRAMERVMEKMEIVEKYTRVKQRKAMAEINPKREVIRAAPAGVDLQKLERTGVESTDLQLHAALKEASKAAMKSRDFGQFMDDIGERGVRAIPNIKQGKMAGFAFAMADAPIERKRAVNPY